MALQKGNKQGIETRFKKGESGNPNGRPVGVKSLKTRLTELLNTGIQYKSLAGKPINTTAGEGLALALIAKGLTTGDYKTIEYITQTIEGTKPPEDIGLQEHQKAIIQRAQERFLNQLKDVTK